MLTPEYLQACADEVVKAYDKLQSDIVNDMVRRITRMGEISESTVYQMEILQESGLVYQDALKAIANNTKYTEKELQILFEDAGAHTLMAEDRIHAAIGKKVIPIHQSERMQNTLQAGFEKTLGEMNNMTMTTALSAQQEFIRAANEAYYQVSSGAMSLNQATRQQIRNLSDQGIKVIHYGTGHKDRVDVAVIRAARTGVNQTAAEVQIARSQEVGNDLVEVTAHAGARPEHAEWQGGVYSLSGTHRKYGDLRRNTGYGSGEGLCGWNCRHSFHTYYEGFSTPSYSRREIRAMDNKDYHYQDRNYSQYEITQMQRGMERGIRDYKRRVSAVDSAIKASTDESLISALEDDFTRYSVNLKGREKELQELMNTVNLPRRRGREQVYGFGRSQAMKAVWADRKAT